MRTVKAPAVRRAEILDAASRLFRRNGYAATPVDDIVREAGVAKGTFYYYFRTKDDILSALARDLVDRMAQTSRAIADDPRLGPLDKIRAIFNAQRRLRDAEVGVVDDLHRPENRDLHERSNAEIVRVFGPILASVVEDGRKSGIFNVDDALSTVQFILAGQLFLFGDGVFDWTAEEAAARFSAMVILSERALGVRSGSFHDLLGDAQAASRS